MKDIKVKEKYKTGIKTIDKEAFFNCKKLKTITIPKSVKKIGKRALGYIWKNNHSNTIICKDGFTIKGYKGTAAEKYAKQNGFKFVAI